MVKLATYNLLQISAFVEAVGVNTHEGAGPAYVCLTIHTLGGVTIASAEMSTSDSGGNHLLHENLRSCMH